MGAPLPQLPPAFAVADEDVRPGGRSMLDLLRHDHRRLARLCAQLMTAVPGTGPEPLAAPAGQPDPEVAPADSVPAVSTAVAPDALASGVPAEPELSPVTGPGPDRPPVAEVVVAMLCRHLSAEEQYLYPTVRAVLPDGDAIAERELAEHRDLLLDLERLRTMAVSDPAYAPLIDAVGARLRRHSEVAEQAILPALQAACTENELIRLGNRVDIAMEAAPTRPHPTTPMTPPANKIVDPAVAVVDKVRDVLTGRPTRSEDLPS